MVIDINNSLLPPNLDGQPNHEMVGRMASAKKKVFLTLGVMLATLFTYPFSSTI